MHLDNFGFKNSSTIFSYKTKNSSIFSYNSSINQSSNNLSYSKISNNTYKSDIAFSIASQINQQNNESINDKLKLADSLMNLNFAKCNKSNKVLSKEYKKQAIKDYIDGAITYIPELSTIKGKTYTRHENLSRSFKQAGKNSYAKGRGVTASLHSITSASNLIGSIIRVAGEASIAAFQTTIGLALAYRFFGDLYMSYSRRNTKAREEINAQYGYPRINKNLEQGINIADAIKSIQNIDLPQHISDLNKLLEEAEAVLNSKDQQLKQEFLTKIIKEYQNNLNPASLAINNLTAARGREKIEWSGFKLTLAVNVLMGTLQVGMSLVSDLSVLFAAPFAPFIKLGLAGASFISVLVQHAINHSISGKNLDKKFQQTIYRNLKTQNYFKAGCDINDLLDLKSEYIQQKKQNQKLQQNKKIIDDFEFGSTENTIHSDEEINNLFSAIKNNIEVKNIDFQKKEEELQSKYNNSIDNIINTQDMKQWWQKPYQHRLRIANEWLEASIHKNLYKFIKLKQQQYTLQKEPQFDQNSKSYILLTQKIDNIITQMQNLFSDKENLSILEIQIKQKSKAKIEDLQNTLEKFTSSELLELFIDDNVAYKCSKFAKKHLENENMRYVASYLAPSLLSTALGASLAGGILDSNIINYAAGAPPVPLQASLNIINHGQSLATSCNNELREAVKVETEKNLNQQRQKKQVSPYVTNMTPSQFLQQINTDDSLMQAMMQNGDINFINQNDEIYLKLSAGRNKHKLQMHDLNTYSYKFKTFRNMMIGGIKGPYLHYFKARKILQEQKNNIQNLQNLTTQLEKKIGQLQPNFYQEHKNTIYRA